MGFKLNIYIYVYFLYLKSFTCTGNLSPSKMFCDSEVEGGLHVWRVASDVTGTWCQLNSINILKHRFVSFCCGTFPWATPPGGGGGATNATFWIDLIPTVLQHKKLSSLLPVWVKIYGLEQNLAYAMSCAMGLINPSGWVVGVGCSENLNLRRGGAESHLFCVSWLIIAQLRVGLETHSFETSWQLTFIPFTYYIPILGP